MPTKTKKLVMFDFDDTLARTEEVTLVKSKKHHKIVDHIRGQRDFDNYKLKSDKYYFDFSEFHHVSEHAKPIPNTLNLLKKFLKEPDITTIVLTARQKQAEPAVKDYLKGLGVDTNKLPVFGCNGSSNKANFLKNLIEKYGVQREVIVFEDSISNIIDMLQLEYEMPHLKFDFIQVIDPENTDEDLDEARKNEYPTGEYGTEPYQRLLKRLHPAKKRRLIGLGGNNYLDQGHSNIKDFSRSKSAPPGG